MQHWQLQEAKQRFSELIRAVETDGPQVVTRHGTEIAVVLEIADFHRLKGEDPDFKSFLVAAPSLDNLEIERSTSAARAVELA